jgi:AraC-like DNA-binding protein
MESAQLVLHPYSTSHLPPEQRHDAFVNRDWPNLGPVFRSVPTEPFDTASESLGLGMVGVQYGFVTGARWTRDSHVMRSYDPDAMTVAITLAGGSRGIMGERSFLTRRGSVHLVDLSAQADYLAEASRVILVVMPRNVAEKSGLNVRSLHGVVLESDTSAMLAPHLLNLRKAVPELSARDAPAVERTILDLIGLAVSASGREADPPPEMRQRTTLLTARHEIEQGLGSPALSVASLCRRLQVSRTTLHRLFEREGGVTAYIRERRLEAARRLLADSANAEPIYAIAERLGFSDAPHLSRLFRERFGVSPRDFRVMSIEAGEYSSTG